MGKFRTKISSSWYSKDYIVLKYSTNGIFWKKIKGYEYDNLSNWCRLTTKISHYSDAQYLISKFKTMNDIKKYEEDERQRVVKHNKEISEKNKKRQQTLDEIYKKFG